MKRWRDPRIISHGLELSRNTPSWIRMDIPLAGPRMDSQDHRDPTIVELVLTRFMDVILWRLITELVFMLESESVAQMQRSCLHNGSSRLDPALALLWEMISGLPDISSLEWQKNLELLSPLIQSQCRVIGMELALTPTSPLNQ